RAPAVVFSTGGYVAGAAGLSTPLTGSPLVLLNADAAPLLSTRLLRALASAVFCGFDRRAPRPSRAQGVLSGNPVRPDIAQVAAPAARYAQRTGPLHLLVIGGSLGARVLNETLPRAIALAALAARPRVVHQCGAANLEATRAAYAAAGVDAE